MLTRPRRSGGGGCGEGVGGLALAVGVVGGGGLAEAGNWSDALRVRSSFPRPLTHARLLWHHCPPQRAERVEAELWPLVVSSERPLSPPLPGPRL